MVIEPQVMLIAGGMAVAIVVWLVRLEGRVNVTDARYMEIIKRLERIERAQDTKQQQED
jgi:hypothetical protein